MSGPKSYNWQVDESALRERRESARLATEAARLAAALTGLKRDWLEASERYGEAVGSAPDIGAPGFTCESQATFQGRLAELRATLTQRAGASQQAEMLAELAGAMGAGPPVDEAAGGEAALARVIARVQGDATTPPSQLAAAVARNVARLPAGATASERERIESVAAAVLRDAGEPYAELRLDGLRAAVMQVERDVAARERVAEERAYVAEVLAQSLAELGYEVGPSFETSLDEDGFADVAVPACAGYDVRVRSAPAGDRLTFNVVRGEGDVDPLRDAEVEREWCADLPDVVDRLARAGVDVERIAAVPAGAHAVQVDPSLPAIETRGRAQTQRLRERRVDR